uniref:Uncharacterized protein n=1 Tax=viral metagenome TaxID=1070528 RepID=A0A6H1ZSM9_9ZZZZ
MADSHMQYNSHTDGLDCVSTILDKSGAKSVNVYPLQRITRNFNAAMDMYFGWAFRVGKKWNYDDVNETTPPIDTQNIVSGTNRYKIGTFTEKVIRVIRIEVLNSSGVGLSLTPETIDELELVQPGNESGVIVGTSTDTFQERYVNAPSGVPTHYIKYGDFIYLRPNPNYAYTAGLLIYFNRPATYMASTATTTVPGIVLTHIPLVCEMAANEFKYDKGKITLGDKLAFEQYVKSIVEDYFANRDEDIPERIMPLVESDK